MTCQGDHYSMMGGSRAPDIGNIVAVAATLRFRNLFPSIGKAPQNPCQKAAVAAFKTFGMNVCLIKKIGTV